MSDVSLTMDIWTDHRMHAYLAVTAHGEPQCYCYLMVFKSFRGSHMCQHYCS